MAGFIAKNCNRIIAVDLLVSCNLQSGAGGDHLNCVEKDLERNAGCTPALFLPPELIKGPCNFTSLTRYVLADILVVNAVSVPTILS